MAREAYVVCPIYNKDVLFTDLDISAVGRMICTTPEGLYCKNPECKALQNEPKTSEKRDNLSLQEMFGTTFEVIIPEILREMQEDP